MESVTNPVRHTLRALSEAGVRFVVCGGVACVLQGVARATHDLDLRVALEREDLARLLRVAQELGLRPRIPEPPEHLLEPERRRVWTEEKHAVVYSLHAASGAFAVDVFLRYPLTYEALEADADLVNVDGFSVRVSSKRHLIEAKRAVQPPRKQDLRDIEDLEELLRDE
jgi:hypothetical protein